MYLQLQVPFIKKGEYGKNLNFYNFKSMLHYIILNYTLGFFKSGFYERDKYECKQQ